MSDSEISGGWFQPHVTQLKGGVDEHHGMVRQYMVDAWPIVFNLYVRR